MWSQFKNLFSFSKKFNKTAIFAVLICVIIGLLAPDRFVFAQFSLGGAIAGIFAGLFGLVFNIIGTILGAILALIGQILSWVMSPGFISLSYTDPARNEFIRIGWTLTRDLTNIIFVLALVAIGLGTALRISGYQVKKALPILIIIALLVNFTPIICGIIVDASNIVMNFFFEGVTGFDNFTSMVQAEWSSWASGWTDFWKPIGDNEAVESAAGALAIIFYDIIAIFVLSVYIFLFVMRYIMIWVLVILSPFAFASYILPATRRFFSMWWNQFLQWSIIGIIMAFFLYLANHIILLVMSPDFAGQMAGGGKLVGLVDKILPWGIVIVFLLAGLFFGLSSSAMGASQIINLGKRAGGATGKWAARRTGKWAKEKTGPLAKKIGEQLVKTPIPGEKISGFKGKVFRGLTGYPSWAIRGLGGVMTKPFESGRAEIRSAEAEAEKMRKETKVTRIKASASSTEKAGFLKSLIKGLDQDFALEQLGEEEIIKIIKGAKDFESHKGMLRAFPHLAGKVKGLEPGSAEEGKAITGAVKNITNHPEEGGQYVSGTSLKDPRVLESIAENFDGRFLGGLAKQGGRSAVDILQKKFEEKGLDWFLEEVKEHDPKTKTTITKPRNPAVPLYLAGNAAQDLGFVSFGGMSREKMRELVSKRTGKKSALEELWLPGMEGVTKKERERRTKEMLPKKETLPRPKTGTEETESLIKEWPEVEKGMSSEMKNLIKEGKKNIGEINKYKSRLEAFRKSVETLEKRVESLKESGASESLIAPIKKEIEIGKESAKRTQSELNRTAEGLLNIRKEINPYESEIKEIKKRKEGEKEAKAEIDKLKKLRRKVK